MLKVRAGVFETNSSSTHAICIHKQSELKIPSYIYFGLEDLSDEYISYDEVQKRANYLNTILYICCPKTEYINRQKEIQEILKHHNVNVEWAKTKWDIAGEPDYNLYSVKDSCVNVILNIITQNEELLMQFLFGENSTIITGYEDEYCDKIEKQKEKYPEGKEYSYYNETY